MEDKWITISESLPAPYKDVFISDDEGVTSKRAYRAYSENSGNLWIDADNDTTFYFLYEYTHWRYVKPIK